MALPLGTGTITAGGSCGIATSVRTSSCLLGTVTHILDRDGNDGNVADYTCNLKVSEPDSGGTPVGTVVMLAGGGSTGFYETLNNTTNNVILPLLAANWRVVQLAWTGAGFGVWTGSSGSRALAGRTATMMRAIYDNASLTDKTKPFGVCGQSGGSSQIAYALSHYGAGDYLNFAILTSGPPHARQDLGSLGALNSDWNTLCQTVMTVTPGAGGQLKYGGSDASTIDAAYGTATYAQNNSPGPYYYQDSVMNGTAEYRFPKTDVIFLFGDNDSSVAEPMGRLYANTITAKSVSINFTSGSVQHIDVPGSTSGSAVILQAMADVLDSSWSPKSITGLEMWLGSHAIAHMGQEDSSIPGLTAVAKNTDPVGMVDDLSNNAHTIGAVSSGTRPTLTTVSGAYSAFAFSAGMLSVLNSITALKYFQATGIGTIVIRASVNADGVAYTFLDSNAGTTSNAGILVQRTTSNTIQVFVLYASAGNSIFNFTSVGTLVQADGMTNIIIKFNNAGGATIEVGSHGVESFSRLNAPVDTTTNQTNLAIGRRLGGTGALNGSIQHVMLFSTVVGSSDTALLKTWNPIRKSTLLVQSTTPANGYYTMCEKLYDFTDVTTMYQDSARATPVAAANDPIRLIEHKLDPGGHLNRAGLAASTTTRPLFISADQGADWDGVDDNLAVTANNRNRCITWLVLASNRDATNGSHFWASSGGRILVTGTNYTGNAPPGGPGAPYHLVHPGTGNATNAVILNKQAAGDFNLLLIVKEGTTWTLWVSGKRKTITAGITQVPTLNNIGTPQLANWDFDGRGRKLIQWNFAFTEDMARRVMTDLLNTFTDTK